MTGKKRLSAFPRSRDVGKDILGGVKQALTISKGPLSLVPIPALPIAVDAVLGVIDACEKVSGNEERLEELTRHLQSLLTYALTPFVEARSTSDAITITDDLRLRVNQLCSQLIAVASETNKLSKLSTTRHFLRSSEVSGTLQDLNTKIASALDAFRVGGDITKEMLLRKVATTLTGMHSLMLDEAQRDRLNQLPHAPARYSNARTKATECLPNTREEALAEIYKWVDEEMNSKKPSMFILWLCGLPGAGKSSIAKTVAKYLDGKRLLGASFFFSRDDDKCSNHELVMPTIARQLGFYNANVGLHIAEFLKGQPDAGTDSMAYQLENLIIEPLRKAHSSGALIPFAIAMDGLDECVNSAQAENMLELLATGFQQLPVPVLIFITSRPESYLESRFHSQQISPVVSAIRLHEIDEGTVTMDIRRYLETRQGDVAKTHSRAPRDMAWPHMDDIDLLSRQASCLFIYAVTAVTFIADKDGIPDKRMRMILHGEQVPEGRRDKRYTLIDSLYLRILRDALQGDDRAALEASDVRDVVGTVITLQYPLSFRALVEFMDIDDELLHSVLDRLSSVIIYNDSDEVRVRHQSFPDFLVRCTDAQFRIDTKVHETRLAKLCLRLLLSDGLKKNMAGVDASTLNSAIPDVARSVSSEMAYACLRCAWHVVNGLQDEEIRRQTNTFLKTKLLNWFEALSLLGRLDAAFASLSQLDTAYRASTSRDRTTVRLLFDAQRFVQTFFDPISHNARHVYDSALCFTPECMLLHTYEEELEISNVKLLVGRDKQWSSCMRVIEGHSDAVKSVAFSPDNTRIVSGSTDKTIRVWDAASGSLRATLQKHDGPVTSVAISSDNTRIISGSDDRTIRVWDAASGSLQATLRGHGRVTSVAISSDNTRIVSGSNDYTVRVWNATSGTLQATLQGHEGVVTSVAFSSDDTQIVSGSYDETVRVWDATSGDLRATLRGHADWVNSVAFSSDNTRIVSGSDDRTVRVWDTASGNLQATLQGHDSRVTSVAFSSDNTRIVTGSNDNTVRVWDATSVTLQSTLQGHAGRVNSVAFSSDSTRIVSGSDDNTVRVWDATSGALQATSESVNSIAFSSDNTLIVSGSSRKPVRVWDATSGALQATLQGRCGDLSSVAFSSDNTLIVSGTHDHTVRVWNATSGTLQRILQGHRSYVNSVAFSSDNTRIVSASNDGTVRVWNATSGTLQATLQGRHNLVNPVAFSSDNARIVSGSDDSTVRVWDATSGILQATLQGHANWVNSVAFSSDNTRIVSGSRDHTVRVWDIASTSEISILQGATTVISGSFALDDRGWIRDISSHFKHVCWVPVSIREHLKELRHDDTGGRFAFGSVHQPNIRAAVASIALVKFIASG